MRTWRKIEETKSKSKEIVSLKIKNYEKGNTIAKTAKKDINKNDKVKKKNYEKQIKLREERILASK